MCGIWTRYDEKSEIKYEDLYHPIASLSHRGPDSYGWYSDQNVAMVHTRLSIIDLDGGRQPIRSFDHQWLGVVNGELYDYKQIRSELESKGVTFHSQSDSEVLLNQFAFYGTKGFKDIEGEFAFIFYHLKSGRLVFGRDFHGVKPLFYEKTREGITIASELKALNQHSPRVSRPYMEHYFARILVPPYTLLENVWEVLPGRLYKYDPKRQKIACNLQQGGQKNVQHDFFPGFSSGLEYEMFQKLPLGSKRDLRGVAALSTLEKALKDAVRKRLMADVEVGLYLSGGIDSALIAALTVDQGARPRAFTVSFSDLDFDESKKAQQIAQHLGISHSLVEMNGRHFLDHLILSIQAFEHPISNPHGAAKNLLAHHVSQHVKVVLTGDGADEWFGGYEYLRLAKINDFFRQHPGFSRKIQRVFSHREKNRTLVHLSGNSEVFREFIELNFFGHYPSLFGRVARRRFFEFVTGTDLNETMSGIVENLKSLLVEDFQDRSFPPQALDLNTWLGLRTDFLQYIVANVGDRQEMCHSIEGRTPFLGKNVVEVASRLHPYELMSGLNEKAILKKMCEKYYPKEIAQRKKHAFFAPPKYFYLKNHQTTIDFYISLSRTALPWLCWKNIDHLFEQDRRGHNTSLSASLLYLKFTLFSIGVLHEKLKQTIPCKNLKYQLPKSYQELKPYEYHS